MPSGISLGAHPEESPLIVVGPLRSGTTMLRLMLDHHPEIRLFAEFEELTRYLNGPGYPSVPEYARHLATDRHARLKGLEMDGADYVEAARGLVRRARARWGEGRSVFGFTVHANVDRLPELFPRARFVHIVRDPRDVARSCIGMGWVGTVYHGADYWLDAEERWDRLAAQVPRERRHEVRYEELVRAPREVLEGVCAFVGQPFDPAMLEYGAHTTYDAPDARYAQKWRKALSPREVELVELRCGSLMERRGYPRTRAPAALPGAAERLKLELENRRGRARFNVDRLGLPLYLGWITSRRLPLERWKTSVQLRVNAIENANVR